MTQSGCGPKRWFGDVACSAAVRGYQTSPAAQAVARHLNTSHAPECAGTGSRRAR
jgi:hypothetical protein